jgi:thiamine biosynthesis lipoprotein
MIHLAFLLLQILTPIEGQQENPIARVEREAWIMGTSAVVIIEADSREFAMQASETVICELERFESVVSTWRSDSELSLLNTSPVGENIPLSEELFLLLARAEEISRRTKGSFNPFMGSLIKVWDLRGEGRIPNSQELQTATRHAQLDAFALDFTHHTVARNFNSSWIETGAFGKGAALAGLIPLLSGSVSYAEINFGGQVWVYSRNPTEGLGRIIQIAHPSDRNESVLSVRLRNQSIATSGISERFIEVGDESFGHILDPYSGFPVDPWGSVSVISSDPMEADALATALFVMGPDKGFEWARKQQDIAALFIRDNHGQLSSKWTTSFQEFFSVPQHSTKGIR